MNYKNKFYRNLLVLLTTMGIVSCNTDGNEQSSFSPQKNTVATHGVSFHDTQQYDFRDVAYGNGVYVVVGSKGAIYTSTNMKHWFEQEGITSTNLNSVVFNNVRKKFYAVGDGGIVLSSADGVAWTEFNHLSPEVRLNAIKVLQNGNEVIIGDGGNLFDVILGANGDSSDKIINRQFYGQSGADLASSVTSVAIGANYMLSGNSSGIFNTKLNEHFDSSNWQYQFKFDNSNIADITFNPATDYFHALLNNGYVSNLDGRKAASKWTRQVCVAHKGDSPCLTDGTVTTSIATDPSSEHIIVVGGASNDIKHTFVANSEDSNSWDKLDLTNTPKLNKVKCFGDVKSSQCLAVGDDKTLGIINIVNDKLTWKLVNITAPVVTYFLPGDKASRVDLTPIMELGFNSLVTNVSQATVKLYEDHIGGASVELGTFAPSVYREKYSFSPIKPLKELTDYVLVVESGIIDKEDMPIRKKVYTFTTGDFTAPEMVVVNPEADLAGVSLTPNIDIKFSKPVLNVDAKNITLHEGNVKGNLVAISNITPTADNGYTFSPADKLKSLTKYCIDATNGIIDNYDNKLVPTSSCFTTGDYVVPTVTFTHPANNAINVGLDSNIEVKFSKPVKNVSTQTVQIHKDSLAGPLVVVKAINGSGSDYVIDIGSRLNHNTKYFIVLDSGIMDTTPQENKLQTTVFNFQTLEQKIEIDPLPPTAAGGVFVINMHLLISENVKVELPDDFTSDQSTTVNCIANEVCQLKVNVGNMYNYDLPTKLTIKATGLDTLVKAQVDITVSGMPTMAVFSSRDKKVEICKVTVAGLSGCKQSAPSGVGEIFGAKISALGNYIYLMTGLQSQTLAGDGIYKCNINKDNFAVSNCVRQANTSGYNTRTLVLSPDGKYAYFNHMNTQSIDRCNISPVDASLSNCVVVNKFASNEKIERMVMSDSGRNIYVNTLAGVQICTVNTDTGAIDKCQVAGSNTPQDEWGMAMGLENSEMYFMGSTGMKSCARDKDTYKLTNCNTTSDKTVTGLTGLAIARNYVLITNYQDHVAYKCNFSANKRTFSSCTELKGVAGLTKLEAVDIFQ